MSLDMTSTYVELHAHSFFSFGEGASHAHELLSRAAELGYQALALTDTNMCGAMEFARTQQTLIDLQKSGLLKEGAKQVDRGFDPIDYRVSGAITAYSEVDEGVDYTSNSVEGKKVCLVFRLFPTGFSRGVPKKDPRGEGSRTPIRARSRATRAENPRGAP